MVELGASRLVNVARLVRLHNGVLAALGVLAGAWWANRSAIGARTILSALAALLLAFFANAFNDMRDVDIDRVAHPERPIPSGRLRVRQASMVALAAGALSIAVSAIASLWLALVSALVLGGMVLYSTHLKRRGLAGNIVVGVLASLPFAYGAWSVGNVRAGVPLLAIAIPLHLAREVAKDLDDVDGDRLERRTLPVARGAFVARAVVVASTVLALIALVPLMLRYDLFALLVLPAIALSLAAAHRVARGARGGPLLLKSAMVAATLSLLVARS